MSTYLIKSGDTLSKIAAQSGTTVAAIMAANPSIKDANKINAGAALTIPSAPSLSFTGLTGMSNNAFGTTNTSTPATTFNTTPAKTVTPTVSAPATSKPASQPTFDISSTPLAAFAANGTSIPGVSSSNAGQSNSGSSTGASGSNTNTSNIPDTINTGNAALDAAYASAVAYTKNQVALGSTVNSKLEITPDLLQSFISEATQQMDPYYKQQMDQEKEGITASLKNIVTQYQASQGQAIQDFQANLNTERNAAAGAGVAFSGGRGLAENNMLNTTNRTLASLDSTYGLNLGNAVRAGAAALGTNSTPLGPGMSSISLPTLTGASVNLEGSYGGSTPGNALDIGYNPSSYGLGSIPKDYSTAVTGASNQFMSDYLKSAVNNSGVSNPLNTSGATPSTGISRSFAGLNS